MNDIENILSEILNAIFGVGPIVINNIQNIFTI